MSNFVQHDRQEIDAGPALLGIRDAGPYSTRNTAKGALLTEAGQVAGALARGMAVDQVRDAVLSGSLLAQRSINSRKGIWDRIHYRYLTHRIDWIIASLVEALRPWLPRRRIRFLLYLHYALRDRLTYDFVTEVLWHKGYQTRPPVARNDVLDLLDARTPEHPEIGRWTETSRVKLAGNMLSALRDFGVLEGIQKKFLVRPGLPLSTAKHLLRILVAKANVAGKSWRIRPGGSSCSPNRTWRPALANLASEGEIHFEKVGTTVVLQTPKDWEGAP